MPHCLVSVMYRELLLPQSKVSALNHTSDFSSVQKLELVQGSICFSDSTTTTLRRF